MVMDVKDWFKRFEEALDNEKEGFLERCEHAKKHVNDNDIEGAAALFSDMAISGAILSFQKVSDDKRVESCVAWIELMLNIYKRWLEEYPNGFRRIPRRGLDVNLDDIRKIVIEEILDDEEFADVWLFLLKSLLSSGGRVSMPGASIQRQVIEMLRFYFGEKDYRTSTMSNFRSFAMRVGVDIIAKEFERIYKSKYRYSC